MCECALDILIMDGLGMTREMANYSVALYFDVAKDRKILDRSNAM